MIVRGDARKIPLRDETAKCVVTSPPYFQLRDYQCGKGQIGLESTPEAYIAAMVEVFRDVRRVLRHDGVLWLVLDRADYILIGHSHFDHLWGAERIAARTGATIVGSYETVRLLHDSDSVPEAQLLAVAGGEPVHLSSQVRARVFPSLHSCIWAAIAGPTGEACLGDLGLACQERRARESRLMQMLESGELGKDVAAHLAESDRHPRSDGGALAYLIETPQGSILWKDTSGHWSGILGSLRPDVALLAAAGRGNVNGEPMQGSLAGFIASEVDLVRPRKVALCHHDNWMPPLTFPTDVEPIKHEIARRAAGVEFIEMPYLAAYPIFG